MKKSNKWDLGGALFFLAGFILWTVLVSNVDVQSAGPVESTVGFASMNTFFHNLTGVHMVLYTVTDWLGLVPVCFGMGFALLGLVQWIKRKNLLKVDFSILLLGGFYITVMVIYILFEKHVVNYRPILINGYLEPSYPSSTTMLVMCVMPTAILQLKARIRNDFFRRCVTAVFTAFVIFMVVGRLISGVHWITDIIGGALLSAGLVRLYRFVGSIVEK